MGVLSKMASALQDYSYLQIYWLGQAGLLTLIYTLQVVRGTYDDRERCQKGPEEKLGLFEFRKRFPGYHVVGLGWMSYTLWTVISAYCYGISPNESFRQLFEYLASPIRQNADQTHIIVGGSMLTIHILRRIYECYKISIFSRRQIVGPLQVVMDYGYYIAAGLTLLAEGPRLAAQQGCFSFSNLSWYHIFALGMFLHGSKMQYRSFVQLAKMRRNKAGHIVTTAHKMPKAGQFELVSNPQYLGEIMVYGSIAIALGFQHSSWNMLLFYVIAAHLVKARGTHLWYQNKFEDYPKSRRMLVPYLL